MSLTDEESDFLEISERNFKRTYNSVAKVGYADGVSDGQEGVFQAGFDQGYSIGLRAGFEIAKYKSFFSSINFDKNGDVEQLQEESNKYKEMAVQYAVNKHHLQLFKDKVESLSDISKHQNDYIDNRLKELNHTVPVATKFLNATLKDSI